MDNWYSNAHQKIQNEYMDKVFIDEIINSALKQIAVPYLGGRSSTTFPGGAGYVAVVIQENITPMFLQFPGVEEKSGEQRMRAWMDACAQFFVQRKSLVPQLGQQQQEGVGLVEQQARAKCPKHVLKAGIDEDLARSGKLNGDVLKPIQMNGIENILVRACANNIWIDYIQGDGEVQNG